MEPVVTKIVEWFDEALNASRVTLPVDSRGNFISKVEALLKGDPAGKINILEKEVKGLRAQLGDNSTEVQDLQAQLESKCEEVQDLQEKTVEMREIEKINGELLIDLEVKAVENKELSEVVIGLQLAEDDRLTAKKEGADPVKEV